MAGMVSHRASGCSASPESAEVLVVQPDRENDDDSDTSDEEYVAVELRTRELAQVGVPSVGLESS